MTSQPIPLPHKALCLAALLLPMATHAQSLKPGLWEQRMTMKSSSGQMEQHMAQAQAELAKLPPEQRKMAEQMMAQQGVQLGSMVGGGAPMVVKICLSPQQASQLDLPAGDGACTQKISQRSANGFKASFSCAGPPPSSGESDITLQGNNGYSGRSVITTQNNGKPEKLTMDISGRWLSADCGTLKPVQR